jgi:RNA polymerase sigma-70 factor (ECF subfamily)
LDSFGRLAADYYSTMVAAAYAVLGDHHLAEDAVQDAYRKALVKLPTLRNPATFAGWLRRICRNTALDMLKRSQKPHQSLDACPAPYAEVAHDTHIPVRKAIEALPAAFRELIMLRYYGDMSLEGISQMLGISTAAVNGRLTRARRKMAEFLTQSDLWEK